MFPSGKRLFPYCIALLLCVSGFSPASAAAEDLAITPSYSAAALAPGVSADISVRVTIEAPIVPQRAARPPVAISLVIDRSGSMDAARKMEYARTAGKLLVRGLLRDDLFSLVVYDDQVDLLYPLSNVTDKEALIRLIEGINPGDMTNLSGGLEKGIEQLRAMRNEGPCRVILLSDGLANRGVTGVEGVAAIGAKARRDGISVSTMGLGLDFSEDMMQHLAQRGGGAYYYIKDSEYLPSVFREELALVVSSFTRDIRVSYRPPNPPIRPGGFKVYGYTTSLQNDDTHIDISDLSSGEKRQIMLRLSVTPETTSGLHNLGELHCSYTDQASGTERRIAIPLALPVMADAPARDEAEKKAEPVTRAVREEITILDAEEAHVAAMHELQQGNRDKASGILREQQVRLAEIASSNKAAAGKMLQLEQDEMRLAQAASSPAMQSSMLKSSKASAYNTAKGDKQGIMLTPGARGAAVEKLQDALKARGLYKGAVDGVYSREVEEAVKGFQRANSLAADGIAGPGTARALGL